MGMHSNHVRVDERDFYRSSAPEVIRRAKHTTRSDIWSLGVLVYNMMYGDVPWALCEKYELIYKIVEQRSRRRREYCPFLAVLKTFK